MVPVSGEQAAILSALARPAGAGKAAVSALRSFGQSTLWNPRPHLTERPGHYSAGRLYGVLVLVPVLGKQVMILSALLVTWIGVERCIVWHGTSRPFAPQKAGQLFLHSTQPSRNFCDV